MTNLSIQDISALVQAGAAVVAAVATIMIAIVASRFSRRSLAVQIDRELGELLMRNNFEIYANRDVAELYKRTRHPTAELDDLRLPAQMRYRFAIMYQIWRVEQEGLVPDALARYDFDGFLGLMVRTSPEQFVFALTAEGFDAKFMAMVRDRLTRIPANDAVKRVLSRLATMPPAGGVQQSA